MPSSIEQVHQEYRARGLVVLAVNLEESREQVTPWVRDRGLTMDVLMDFSGEAARDWNVAYTPLVYLVGRDGNLVGRAIGRRPWTEPAGRALLDALVAP